jgi:hypothetical protein
VANSEEQSILRASFLRQATVVTITQDVLLFLWRAPVVKKGFSYGATDDYCYNITENPVHVHDLNATIMHLLGVDHKKLTFRIPGQGLSSN